MSISGDGSVLSYGKNLRSRKGMSLGAETAASPGRSAHSNNATTLATYFARLCALLSLVLVTVWVHQYLGGVGVAPEADGASTDKIFNWHPILMTFGFVVLMTEAVLAYKAPWQKSFSRPQRKQVHWILHSLAVLSAALGFLAAWKSHTLKVPPIANFYSPHSYIGSAALLMMLGQVGVYAAAKAALMLQQQQQEHQQQFTDRLTQQQLERSGGLLQQQPAAAAAQYVVGFVAYLFPQIAIERRVALGPVHRFLGLAVYGTGVAAAAVGLQEKATFLQAFGKKEVYSSFIRLPAVTELLLLATVLLVVWHYAAGGTSSKRHHVQYAAVSSAEEGGVAAS